MFKTLSALLLSIACLVYVSSATAAPNPTRLFDWAEKTYPNYFPVHVQSATITVGNDTYIYRYYAKTGNYLGLNVKNCGVYVIGKLTDGDMLFINYFTNFADLYDGLCL